MTTVISYSTGLALIVSGVWISYLALLRPMGEPPPPGAHRSHLLRNAVTITAVVGVVGLVAGHLL